MSVFGTNTFGGAAQSTDVELADPPADSISDLAFSPVADYLAVSSWDNNVRIYEVAQTGQTQGKAMYSHQGPVLSLCWTKDGTKILSGGADNAGWMFDTATSQSQQVAQHDAPIKCVKWIDAAGGLLATGSWDKTIKYWDLRTPNAVLTVQLPERCYAMDAAFPYLVAGTADRHIQIFDLKNPQAVYKSLTSPLRTQTRVIKCIPSSDGYTVGALDGRLAVQYIEPQKAVNNYSFKCHRKEEKSGSQEKIDLYSVNDVSFHPIHGTISTCGSDGAVCFWDIYARSRLKSLEPAPGPVSATAFNRTGTFLAYAVSYDWHRGHAGMTPGHPNKVILHACKDDELKRRPQKR